MLAAPGPTGAARIDPLTLAAFQDTGWYAVNTSRAQNLVWGKGKRPQSRACTICQIVHFQDKIASFIELSYFVFLMK